MYKYVLKRLLLIIPVVLFVLFVVYTIMALTPGDPGRTISRFSPAFSITSRES